MNTIYLEVIDQIRFMAGLLIAVILFTIDTIDKREKFLLKSVLGFIGLLVISLGILLVKKYLFSSTIICIIIYSIWYELMTVLSIIYIMFCFEITICNAIFRCIFGVVSQQIATIIFNQWFIGMIYPNLKNNHPVIYIIALISFYVLSFYIIYKYFVKRIQKDDGLTVSEDKATFIANVIMLIIFSCIFNLSSVVLEMILPEFSVYGELALLTKFLKYFCLLFELLFGVVLFIIQFNTYKNKRLQREKTLLIQMAIEKKNQYRVSSENVEFIKQKVHDLKYYMLALEVASEEERKKIISEIKQEVMIYDGIIKTDNEVLNIILTEKNLYCNNRNIRLSNNIYTTEVDFINVIDLYAIIGNALDNSIECVSKFKDDDKKIISFSIDKVGQLLSITTENYYENEIIMKEGLPITSKVDKSHHGLGIKNIKMLAKKYNGHIRVNIEDNIFTLHILIPVPDL